MSYPIAPFTAEALRPFVSVGLYRVFPESDQQASEEITQGLASRFEDLFTDFDIQGENRFKISGNASDRGVIAPFTMEEISLTGIWFKRISAPAWLDARLGFPSVQDITNHIILVAIKLPYLALLGTHAATTERMAGCMQQGYFYGTEWLGFIAKQVSEVELEEAFIRGRTRYFALSGLHAPVETKPDSKSLSGLDLRMALDPFADQSFTFTSVVSILPPLDQKRKPRHQFNDNRRNEHEHYAFRVGVNPEEHRVWTVPTEDFNHLLEELCVLFDTLELRSKRKIPGTWGYNQDGFRFLGKAKLIGELSHVHDPFDVSLEVPPPIEPGKDILTSISSELQRCQELWRACGKLEVVPQVGLSASFKARLYYGGEPIAEYTVTPFNLPNGRIGTHLGDMLLLGGHDEFHLGITCFDTIWKQDGAAITIRYDSGHVIRDSRIFKLGWEDVMYEAWDWPFRTKRDGHIFRADLEKPLGSFAKTSASLNNGIPDRKKSQGWEADLGEKISTPASLFEYVVIYAKELFNPKPGNDWHLCCDDGPGEVADFVYFEPLADFLCLIHIKGAHSSEPGRKISVKAYEEVTSQAVKNLRYLDISNLVDILEMGRGLPIAQACFYNTTDRPYGSREKLLEALRGYDRRLKRKKVIIFQPHVHMKDWFRAKADWENKKKATPHNQINRFLQLRTLLADAEITCRKMGASFETWGENDTAPASPRSPEVKEVER
jgi:hypothetical protein